MPLFKLHEETFSNVNDYGFLAKLAMDCVYRCVNSNMVCGILCVLLKKQVFAGYINPSEIRNDECLKFFQEQFDRAIVSI